MPDEKEQPRETFGADDEVARARDEQSVERQAEIIARAVSEGVSEAIQPLIDKLEVLTGGTSDGFQFDRIVSGEGLNIAQLDQEVVQQVAGGNLLNQDSLNIEDIRDNVAAILTIMQSQGGP
jgi:hypothetical protein